ncbi:MAG: SAM-dependent chlorinase/fluorinase [Anaerolineales bacterium]
MRIITLTTDFGTRDGYPGIMKGVILGICPQAQIVDITHEISPQQVLEGALTLARSAPYYPPNTVHIAVVDPGVGTERRPLAARLGQQYYVFPDNGLISAVLMKVEEKHQPIQIVHLNRPQYWLPNVSNVFHGRDIFAPVGAHLANGTPLSDLGTSISDPYRLELPTVEPIPNGWRGAIIHIDHFGNVATNLQAEHVQGWGALEVRLVGQVYRVPLTRTFGENEPGKLVALIDSSGYLALCVVNGSAAARINTRLGDSVEIVCKPK